MVRHVVLPALPAEMHSMMISETCPNEGGGKETLLACSLVCRAWNDKARPHIFRSVFFIFDRESPPPGRKPKKKPQPEPLPPLREFHKFLNSHSDICRLIHRLGLCFCGENGDDEKSSRIGVNLLCSIFNLLPNLEYVKLESIRLKDRPYKLPSPRVHRSLRILEIDFENSFKFPTSTHDLTALADMFEHIGSLRLGLFLVDSAWRSEYPESATRISEIWTRTNYLTQMVDFM